MRSSTRPIGFERRHRQESPSPFVAQNDQLDHAKQRSVAETEEHYNYFRDYDSSIGRYLESDPIGLDGGLNTFSYTDAAPLQWTDDEGLTRGRGERGATGGAGGQRTNNPNKHCRELNPPDPKFVECRHHQTGKWIRRPRPDDMPFPEPTKSMSCENNECSKAVAVVAGVAGTYLLYRCVRMLPSLAPPLWWTIPANAATP